ncbi:Proprotein convertase P [Isosphaera pallida ATCC 43644]|uniref:Proprotein convertase P n=1 Tax=Isosphaera pallida (strain ATCC 43644 / DSM 9630 / IS1B) TaxID=575540 RepID=E8R1H0_ISOPI|nr:proprotein convertase P-domain-containing protein [Isosphaera pallida]ADV62387.1 Proprotein convertase P [Isosphaera pallida ATCC 43644]
MRLRDLPRLGRAVQARSVPRPSHRYRPADLGGGVTGMTLEARQLLTITGTVFEDWNADGVRDPFDTGLAGTRVFLDSNGNGIIDGPTFTSTTAIPIIDNQTNSGTLTIAQSGTVVGMTVTVNVTHTWMGDVTLRLISPLGTVVTLIQGRGGSGDNMNGTIFDDSAPLPISAGSPPFAGRFRPETPLAAFNGQSITGTWRLDAQDSFAGDQGQVTSWSLQFLEPSVLTDANGNFSFPGLGPGTYPVRVQLPGGFTASQPGSDFQQITLTAANPTANARLGLIRQGAIYGRAFSDLNGNGQLDPGEVGLAGWSGFLDTNGNGVFDSVLPPQIFNSTDTPKPFVDGGLMTSVATVNGAPSDFLNMRVTINGTHTWVGDMVFTLVSPGGVRVTLINGRGGSGDNFTNMVFDDNAALPISSATPPFTGSWRPEQPLAAFRNTPVNGVWTLECLDTFPADSGILQSWTIEFVGREPQFTTNSFGFYRVTAPGSGTFPVIFNPQPGWEFSNPATGVIVVPIPPGGAAVGRDIAIRPIPVLLDPSGVRIENGAAQRSMVRTISFTLNGIVSTMPAGAFTVNRVGGGPAQSFEVRVISSQVVQGRTNVVLGFTGPGLAGGSMNSLPDGVYEMVINGSAIIADNGLAVDFDGDGVAGGSLTVRFHRFFGDSDGDGDVDMDDYNRFRRVYVGGFVGDSSHFDFDGNNLFTSLDLNEFLNNFRRRRLF